MLFKEADTYFQEARSWETDKVQVAQRSCKRAWIVASAACVLAALGVTSTLLIGIKDPSPPTVVRIDNSTGMVDLVSTIRDVKTNYDETVNRYFVQLYMRYREGYSKELAEEYYYNTGLMSCTQEQHRYLAYFSPKLNPQAPLNIYGDYAKAKIEIKGTSFISPHIALVRYAKTVTRTDDSSIVSHWAATINFRYSPLPMSEKDRGINPLGFQVCEYRNDPDTPIIEKHPMFPTTSALTPVAVVPAVKP